ncbi:MAG: ribose-5-phosphate isomerase RpiA [Lactobacillales bacterium]|jgi:ribose 5-phosphate isomerase A|nr:ribose-5-phosphate isomerase RpiA [Lactobacillales bacterium]
MREKVLTQEELKKQVGIEAAKYVKNEMIVGLGTGSTANYMIDELGRKIKEEHLKIIGVTTSKATSKQAQALGIPLKAIDEVEYVDLTIDSADEISENFHGIKGGGGALLFEKIVASYSRQYIWIVDESKLVKQLGAFPLPVEVVKYGAKQLYRFFENKGYHPHFRTTNEGKKFITDSGNYIIDLHLEVIANPIILGEELDKFVGVVEHGLFLNMVNKVIVGTKKGLRTYSN